MPVIRSTAAPSSSAADIRQAAAARAEGLELFAMAKAIPRLQNSDGAPFKFCFHLHHHLYYFTCHQADILDLQSQMTTLMSPTTRGPQELHLRILIYQNHRYGALLRV